jgi:hypothetical protein
MPVERVPDRNSLYHQMTSFPGEMVNSAAPESHWRICVAVSEGIALEIITKSFVVLFFP